MASGYKFYSGLKGSKTLYVGQDPDVYEFTSIADAYAEAGKGSVIYIEPGTYTLTTQLLCNKPGVSLVGLGGANDVVITSALTTATVMINQPATGYAAASTFRFKNIKFDNSSTGDAVEIDNDGGLAQNMNIFFEDCSILNSGTGACLDKDQTTATKDMFLFITGNPCFHSIGASTIDQTKAASYTVIHGMYCSGAFAISNTAVASTFNMVSCVYASQAQTTGGNAANLTNYVGNIYAATGFAAGVTKGIATDFDAGGTEAAILFA
jgi:hypothetical protein